jgi:hypothetical protein
MKVKLLLLFVLFVLAVSVNAQNKDEKTFKFGAGALIGLPMGDYNDVASLAYGIDLMGEYAVAPNIAINLSAGFLDWALKNGYSGNSSSIPVLLGGKYSFSDKLYGSLQAGITYQTESGGSAFTFAPGIGYKISKKFDLLLKYQSAVANSIDMSFLGLRAIYTF